TSIKVVLFSLPVAQCFGPPPELRLQHTGRQPGPHYPDSEGRKNWPRRRWPLIPSISRPGTASAGRSKANPDSMALSSLRELGHSPSPTEAPPNSPSWPTRTATGPSPPSSPPPIPSQPTLSRRSSTLREKEQQESSTEDSTTRNSTNRDLVGHNKPITKDLTSKWSR
ncbi:UNVERIFIED_CONTAM: hypothetical protein GTU68_020315, partial [Idotea baltica]|nr:hypothetical protein [Idotea baltica]